MVERTARIVAPGAEQWIGWLGRPIAYLGRGEDTDGRYCLSRCQLPAGTGPTPHRHGFAESYYVLEGEVTLGAGCEQHLLRAGDFVHVPPGVVHYVRNATRQPADVLMLAAPAGLDRLQLALGQPLADGSAPVVPPTPDDHARVEALAAELGIDLHPPAEAFDDLPRLVLRRRGQGLRIVTAGDLYTFLAEAADTDGHYTLWHAAIPPGSGPPPHVHRREEEGFFVLTGEVTFYPHGKPIVAGPGTYACLPIGVPHHFKNQSDAWAEMLIFVAPSGLERFFQQVGTPWIDDGRPIPPPDAAELARLIELAPSFGIELLIGPH